MYNLFQSLLAFSLKVIAEDLFSDITKQLYKQLSLLEKL